MFVTHSKHTHHRVLVHIQMVFLMDCEDGSTCLCWHGWWVWECTAKRQSTLLQVSGWDLGEWVTLGTIDGLCPPVAQFPCSAFLPPGKKQLCCFTLLPRISCPDAKQPWTEPLQSWAKQTSLSLNWESQEIFPQNRKLTNTTEQVLILNQCFHYGVVTLY